MTGGAGFVGSHLVDALVAQGHQVTVIDDLTSGTLLNLADCADHIEVVQADAGSSDPACRAALRTADLVYHLASPVGVALAHARRREVMQRMLSSGSAVVTACAEASNRLVLVSSSEVYGAGQDGAIAEDRPCRLAMSARWGYGAAKLALDHLALGAAEEGADVRIVRPFNLYGPRQNPAQGHCISSFVGCARAGRPLTIHGSGSQRRSFLHVDDAVRALLAIGDAAKARGRIVNLGHSELVCVNDVAGKLEAVVGQPLARVHVDYPSAYGEGFDEAHVRYPDVTLLCDLTGWTHGISLEQGLREMWSRAVTSDL